MGILADMIWRKICGGKLLQMKSKLGHETEFNQGICLESKRDDLERFDMVDLTGIKIATDTVLEQESAREVLCRPPLFDFIFKINDSSGNAVEFLLHYYGRRSKSIVAKDGLAYVPLLNIFQLDQKRDVVAILQVLTPRRRQHMEIFCTRLVAIKHYDSMSSYEAAISNLEPAAEYVLWHYIYMATQFRSCPERFVKTERNNCKIFTMGAEPVKPLRETKVERRVVAEKESETQQAEDEAHRKMTCPYWTVRGHERHLKNGRVIWIKPYIKGKDRDNPEKNIPKKYHL